MAFIKRLDFSIRKECIYGLVWLALIPLIHTFFPDHVFGENSYIENMQLAVIVAAAIISLKISRAEQNIKIFTFIFMLSIIFFLREVSHFRVFLPPSESTKRFSKWVEVFPEYGFLVPLAYKIFIGYVAYYLFFKCRKAVFLYIKNARIPVFETALATIGIVAATVSESLFHNEKGEELFEMLFYIEFAAIIWIYGFNEKFFLPARTLRGMQGNAEVP
ncbi:MAG: hypothetical protein LBE22_07315 [Azoarcus sp.]|jgi:hypothetical protein|nr:hypothetical protein [Azoarcus sp.]